MMNPHGMLTEASVSQRDAGALVNTVRLSAFSGLALMVGS